MNLPPKPRRDEVLDLRIERIDPKGRGMARHDERDVQVPRALPSERVRARVVKVRKGLVFTRLQEIVEPSPDRIEPRCTHAGTCGGCTLQTLSYASQLALKADVVRGLLAARGVDSDLLREPIACATPFDYRNKMEFSFGLWEDRTALGLHPPGYKYEVFGVERCWLESEDASRLCKAIGQWARDLEILPFVSMGRPGFLRTLTVREGKRTGERLVELTTTGDDVASMGGQDVAPEQVAASFCEAVQRSGVDVTSLYWTQHRAVKGERTRMIEHHLAGAPVLRERLQVTGRSPLEFEIHPRAFFQPNTLQAEVLYEEVARAAALEGGEHVLDLYCGTGTIGLCLAHRAGRITGIELVEDAVVNARANAAHNGIDNVTFFAGDVAKVLAAQSITGADRVVLDPPRSGLLPGALELVTRLDTPRLVYVSCNPKALARDLVALHAAGWRTESIQPVDMFPQTAHIENVAVLVRA